MHIQFKTTGGSVVTLPEGAIGLRKAESTVSGNAVTRHVVDVLGYDATYEISGGEYDEILNIMAHSPEGGVVGTSGITDKKRGDKQ